MFYLSFHQIIANLFYFLLKHIFFHIVTTPQQIISTKLQWNAKPKIGSLDNAHHKPGGGDKKIEEVKLDFKDKAKPKIGSLENAQYVAKGGDVKVSLKPMN